MQSFQFFNSQSNKNAIVLGEDLLLLQHWALSVCVRPLSAVLGAEELRGID